MCATWPAILIYDEEFKVWSAVLQWYELFFCWILSGCAEVSENEYTANDKETNTCGKAVKNTTRTPNTTYTPREETGYRTWG